MRRGACARRRSADLKNDSKDVALAPGQRLRPLARNLDHLIAGLVGILPGFAIGAYRTRILYVRAEPRFKSVVLTRSAAEYLALAFLLVVKIVAEYSQAELGAFSLIIAALLALIVVESITRSALTAVKYRREARRGTGSR